jgi:hypothetical protein
MRKERGEEGKRVERRQRREGKKREDKGNGARDRPVE